MIVISSGGVAVVGVGRSSSGSHVSTVARWFSGVVRAVVVGAGCSSTHKK